MISLIPYHLVSYRIISIYIMFIISCHIIQYHIIIVTIIYRHITSCYNPIYIYTQDIQYKPFHSHSNTLSWLILWMVQKFCTSWYLCGEHAVITTSLFTVLKFMLPIEIPTGAEFCSHPRYGCVLKLDIDLKSRKPTGTLLINTINMNYEQCSTIIYHLQKHLNHHQPSVTLHLSQ